MSSVYVYLCLLIIVIASIFFVSKISRKLGRSDALADIEAENSLDREKFDKASRRPLARGNDLIRRMREWSEK